MKQHALPSPLSIHLVGRYISDSDDFSFSEPATALLLLVSPRVTETLLEGGSPETLPIPCQGCSLMDSFNHRSTVDEFVVASACLVCSTPKGFSSVDLVLFKVRPAVDGGASLDCQTGQHR